MRRILAIFAPLAGISGVIFFSWGQTALTAFTAGVAVGAPACSNADASLFGVITGIEVLADTLTEGHGCGTGPGQIFKYAAVVTVADSDPSTVNGSFVAGSVTDCFASATFQNLCAYGDASTPQDFTVTVYAFTEDQWNRAAPSDGGIVPTGAACGPFLKGQIDTNSQVQLASQDAGYCTNPPLTTQFTVSPGTLTANLQAYAGWMTTCTATQQSNVPVVAKCEPLGALR